MSVSPEALLEREQQNRKSDRISGVLLAVLMLAALSLVAQRIYAIATGPKPPGPGVSAPAFTGVTLKGSKLSLADHGGKVVLLDFWATWCPPCVATMPHLQAIHDDYADRGVAVIGVNQEPGEEEKVRRFLRARNLTFPSVVDRGGIHVDYGVYSFPTTFVIDGAGVIRTTFRGPASHDALRRAVDAALDSHPALR